MGWVLPTGRFDGLIVVIASGGGRGVVAVVGGGDGGGGGGGGLGLAEATSAAKGWPCVCKMKYHIRA